MQLLASLAELLLKINRPLTPAKAGAAAPQGQLPVCTLRCVLLPKVKAAALRLLPAPPRTQLQ